MQNLRNAECHTAISCLSNIAHRRQIHLPQIRHCLHAKIKCVQLCVCVWGGGEVINNEIMTTQLCLVAQ